MFDSIFEWSQFNNFDKANTLSSLSKLLNCDHSKIESNINSLISENRFLNSKLKEIEIIEQSRMFDTMLSEIENVNTTNILCKILDQDFD